MIDDKTAEEADETHEHFVKRAGDVFPVSYVRSWSRVERAVFNHLVAQLINNYRYAAITNEMLRRCRDDMEEIVRRLLARAA